MIIINGLVFPNNFTPDYIKNRSFTIKADAYVSVLYKDKKVINIDKHLNNLNKYTKNIHKKCINKQIIKKDCLKMLDINHNCNYGIMYIHTYLMNNNLNYLIFMQEFKQPVNQYINGLKSCLIKDIRFNNSNVKSLSNIGNIQLKKISENNNILDPILYRNNFITEAAHSNVFIIKNDVVITNDNDYILKGTVRDSVINICKQNEIPFIFKEITIEELFNADSVFITNIIEEITPIIDIENNKFKICNLLIKLQKLYKNTQL